MRAIFRSFPVRVFPGDRGFRDMYIHTPFRRRHAITFIGESVFITPQRNLKLFVKRGWGGIIYLYGKTKRAQKY